MASVCELEAVIVSVDSSVITAMTDCLGELGIHANVEARSSAIEMLAKRKTDAFFVDKELDPELTVIEHVRTSPSSRTAVTFAIVPASDASGLALRRADFVVDKPLTHEHVRRSLRASYGIMLKERRRYTRYALMGEAKLKDSTGRTFLVRTTNISQTGLALECPAPLIEGESVQVQFRLPHSNKPSSFHAQVIWTAANGKAGLAFTRMRAVDRDTLTEWIDGEFLRQWHPLIPEAAAAGFMHATR
jgi:hypothetical protein